MFGCCCGEVVLIKVLGKGEMIMMRCCTGEHTHWWLVIKEWI